MAKILVVDDQVGVRRLLGEAFREDPYEIKLAANGAEALQLFGEFRPNLILMDMKMPGLNGIEVLKKIRILDRQVKVIIMTAYGDIQNESSNEDDGIFCYVGKPFDLFELKDLVRKILGRDSV